MFTLPVIPKTVEPGGPDCCSLASCVPTVVRTDMSNCAVGPCLQRAAYLESTVIHFDLEKLY